MPYEPTPFDQYTTWGLQQAQDILKKSMETPSQYPGYVPSQGQAPIQMGYYQYTPTAPMARVAAPDYTASAGAYKGLLGGDYGRLEQALRTPGELAAQEAYTAGSRDLANVMGGRGLYGSSIMGNQMNEGLLREYINALSRNAADATAKRYSMEQAELAKQNEYNLARETQQNQFAAQMFGQKVAQEGDLYKAAAAEAANRNAYEAGKQMWDYQLQNAMRDWMNSSAYEKYTYDLARQAYENQMQEMLMNRALAIAGQGAPLSQSYLNYQIAQQQSQAARDAAALQSQAATTAGLYTGLGSLGGGLLGGKGNLETLGSWASKAWDWLTG